MGDTERPEAGAGPAPTGAVIRVRDLVHRYASPSGELTVLDGVNLDIEAGDHIALMAESGAGKTTLLSLLGGLEPVQHGSVEIDGTDLSALHSDDLAGYRRSTVGFVFQHFGLLDTLTALENIELACTLAGVERLERRERAQTLLEHVSLTSRSHHRPGQMSGGERQRVALARALSNRPRLILADEPTGNLDGRAAVEVMELLERLRDEYRCTLLIVTHNEWVAGRADRLATLTDGKVDWS